MQSMNRDLRKALKALSKLQYFLAVYLFGSQSTGRARKDSDIDLAVITSPKATEMQITDIYGYGSEKLDIHPFEKLPLPIQFRVFKEGKLLFSKDNKALAGIKVKTWREYLDFAPKAYSFYRKVLTNVRH